MIVRTHSATRHGMIVTSVEIEVKTVFGKPQLVIIGLPEKTIVEAKERITAALTACGVRIKAQRTVVNLAPADRRKNGSSLELAIAIALLKLYKLVPANTNDTLFIGELSLDGAVKPVQGALMFAQRAAQLGFSNLVVPYANAREAAIVTSLAVHPISHLREYLGSARQHKTLPIARVNFTTQVTASKRVSPQISDVIGQFSAKRALEIAAAGGHHLLMTGSPGIGKTMLAKALLSILPPLSQDEMVEVTAIHSLQTNNTDTLQQRPFCAPHHSITRVGLIGGGTPPQPGQISFAHHGILFLDEIAEFAQSSLESLRQPLETGTITIVRSQEKHQFPARFTLVASANPCPCGYYQSSVKACRCTQSDRARYARKLSGPLLDRIDLIIPVVPTGQQSMTTTGNEPTAAVLARVVQARARQTQRFGHSTFVNAQMTSTECMVRCQLHHESEALLTRAATKLSLSTRGYYCVMRVAQTIADLSDAPVIEPAHIAEALQYRITLK